MLERCLLLSKLCLQSLIPNNCYILCVETDGFCDKDYTYVAVLCPGCGVFAQRVFSESEFLLEYRGELTTGAEGEKRHRNGQSGTHLYFFKVEGRKNVVIRCINVSLIVLYRKL